MLLDKIQAQPEEGLFNVIVEIPMNDSPIKYEFDKDSGAIIVDRFMQTAMRYPCNYGFIPHTLSGDGDPVDVLVISHHPIIPGAIIKSKPIGVLMMEDESGIDEKIIAIPAPKLDISLAHIKNIDDIDQVLKQRINHFFEHYKDLDKGKWVKIIGWDNRDKALSLINEGLNRAKK